MKKEIKTIETICDICGEIAPTEQMLFAHTTGYDSGGSSIGINIIASPFGYSRVDSCDKCNEGALLAASKTLPQWNHLNRAKQLLLDFVAWYEIGDRERQDLDKIYDLACDLFPNR